MLDQGEDSLVKDVYELRMKQIQNANIIIKGIDTLIEAVRVTYDPTSVNQAKVAIGVVHTTLLYMGKTETVLLMSIIEGIYQAYEGDWEEVVKTATFGTGITIMYSVLCSTLPAISLPFATGFTMYSAYYVLNNGYELYNELHTKGITKSNSIRLNVANNIEVFVSKHATFQEMNFLQKKYISMLAEYQDNPELNILSSIRVDKLDTFNEWLPEAAENYATILLFLVSNMLKGDIFSLNIFDGLCRYIKEEYLIVSYDILHEDDALRITFVEYGGAEDARAVMSAENWLESASAAEIFMDTDDLEILCNVNHMLHLDNEHIIC